MHSDIMINDLTLFLQISLFQHCRNVMCVYVYIFIVFNMYPLRCLRFGEFEVCNLLFLFLFLFFI